VSSYNKKTSADVDAYVKSRFEATMTSGGVRLNPGHTHWTFKVCPEGFCTRDNQHKPDNQWKLNLLRDGGAYHCFRCGHSGSYYDFKLKFSGCGLGGPRNVIDNAVPEAPPEEPLERPRPSELDVEAFPGQLQIHPEGASALAWLHDRNITSKTLAVYNVGHTSKDFFDAETKTWQSNDCVTFPWHRPVPAPPPDDSVAGRNKVPALGFEVVRIKLRSILHKRHQRIEPSGGHWGLFGLHTADEETTEIVLTEGEFDAMAVYQGTGKSAISLPNGASSLPTEVLPLLERFRRIYLWMDNDGPGQAGLEKFAKKLGAHRCYHVRNPPSWHGLGIKDANDALINGVDLQEALDQAKRPTHEFLLRFAQLRADVWRELKHPAEFNGTPITSWPLLTKMLLGVRRGELTILTGRSGAGKTTLASQMTLDMLNQRVPTLWGSFEVKNTSLSIKMLRQSQRSSTPLSEMPDHELDEEMNRFQQLPLFFLAFHGATDVDKVIDAMEFAVYAHDVEHIVLDNLQFMTSGQSRGSGFNDKFEAQDQAVAKFRKFATQHGCHVVLVVHPRKEDEGQKLGLSSIYGGGKVTQEADTVMCLQMPEPPRKTYGAPQPQRPEDSNTFKYVEIVKNRYAGRLGSISMSFDEATLRYAEMRQIN